MFIIIKSFLGILLLVNCRFLFITNLHFNVISNKSKLSDFMLCFVSFCLPLTPAKLYFFIKKLCLTASWERTVVCPWHWYRNSMEWARICFGLKFDARNKAVLCVAFIAIENIQIKDQRGLFLW